MFDHLPYDLLRPIIRDADDEFLSFYLPSSPGIILPPITASHVCRSWRAALLSDPSMWTCLKILQMKPQQIKEMLHRSAHAPLNVFIEENIYNCDNPFYPPEEVCQNETFSLVFKEMSRIKKLQIHVSIPTQQSFRSLTYQLLKSLDQPAPMLQEFYLGAELHYQAKLYKCNKIIQDLFSGNAPNLKHISQQISDNAFQLGDLQSSPCFQNLHSLCLHFRGHMLIQCDTFLDVLQSSPSLRALEIRVSQENPALFPSASAARRVSLPHLQSLSLKNFCGVVIANLVLGHLIFPQSVNYHIECIDFQRKIFHTALLLDFLAQRRLTYLHVSFFRWEVLLAFHDQQRTPHASTFIQDSLLPSQTEDSLHNLLQIFRLSDITCLTLNLNFTTTLTDTQTRIQKTFPLLVNLEILEIRYDSQDPHVIGGTSTVVLPPSTFLLILPPAFVNRVDSNSRDDGDDGDNNSKLTCPCPSLRALDISVPTDSLKLAGEYATMLGACCDFRQKTGHPFEAITIRCSESSLTEEAVTFLQLLQGFPITVTSKEQSHLRHLC